MSRHPELLAAFRGAERRRPAAGVTGAAGRGRAPLRGLSQQRGPRPDRGAGARFPVIDRLVGAEFFAALARIYCRRTDRAVPSWRNGARVSRRFWRAFRLWPPTLTWPMWRGSNLPAAAPSMPPMRSPSPPPGSPLRTPGQSRLGFHPSVHRSSVCPSCGVDLGEEPAGRRVRRAFGGQRNRADPARPRL